MRRRNRWKITNKTKFGQMINYLNFCARPRRSDGMTFEIFISSSMIVFRFHFERLCICYLLRIVISFQCVFDLNRPAAINSSGCCRCCLLPQMRTNARLNFEHNLLNLITITYVFTQRHCFGIELNSLCSPVCLLP